MNPGGSRGPTRRTRRSGLAGLGSRRSRAPFLVLVAVLGLALLVVVVGLVRYLGALPAPSLAASPPGMRFSGDLGAVPWPTGAEGTIALAGVGDMTATGAQPPTPIASVTKIMAAVVVLRDHPLALGAQGPSITVSPADVATYQSELAQGDSVVAVQAGERLSELDALEAALVPSGDNIVRMLAAWDAGSVPAFVAKMNATARSLGLAGTHYAEPSGVDPATVSTSRDQVTLAAVAMRNPVFAHIVSLSQVTLPVAGVQYNVDADLGKSGIVGVKTGWIPAGGASFVFATDKRVGARRVSVIGAVLGVQGRTPLPSALSAALSLAAAGRAAVRVEPVVAPGARLGTLRAPYARSVDVVAAGSATLVGWPGAAVKETVSKVAGLVAPVPAGTVVGHLEVSLGTEHAEVALVTAGRLSGPSFSWRLTR